MSTLLHRLGLDAGALVLLAAVAASALVVSQSIETPGHSMAAAERPAETAQRGFLLTGDESYLGPYRGVEARTDSLLARLDSLVASNPAQVRRPCARRSGTRRAR